MIKVGFDFDFFCKFILFFIIVCKKGKLRYVKVLIKVGLDVN